MICNEPKRIISANGGFELLQMVLDSDTERCASKDVDPPKRVDHEIPHWLERE